MRVNVTFSIVILSLVLPSRFVSAAASFTDKQALTALVTKTLQGCS